ncbi:hypothetical protein FIU95_12130 [Microbulbifer sp. THAF38]|nr:hypothetical protein FIU95_12130 [Microbulbifer sp. THAF38]
MGKKKAAKTPAKKAKLAPNQPVNGGNWSDKKHGKPSDSNRGASPQRPGA